MNLDALWVPSSPRASERRLREALAELPPSPTPLRVELLSQLARAVGEQGRYREALGLLAIAETLNLPPPRRCAVLILLERGRVHLKADEPKMARNCLEQAQNLAEAVGERALAQEAAALLAQAGGAAAV